MAEPTDLRARLRPADLRDGFRALGLRAGDLVLVHASLRRFGYLEEGPESVLDALLEVLGPTGTLALPGFSFQLLETPSPVFDVRHTPVWASKLYESFRTRAGVCRSHHLSHSVCAHGARAQELTANHPPAPCGAGSPFCKLAQEGGKILLLGVSHNSSTTFHAVEEQEQLFYVGLREMIGATLIDEQGRSRPLHNFAHQMRREYDFNRLEPALTGEGIQQQLALGEALLRLLDARAMYHLAVAAVRRDPEALLMQGTEKCKIPVSVHGEMA